MLKSALIVCCLLSLAMCNRVAERRHPRDDTASVLTPANPRNLNMAADAVKHLRESFNTGKCDLIYIEASEEFHGLESRE